MENNRKAIEQKAYELFVDEGRPSGKDVEHWLAAEKSLAENKFSLTQELNREEGEGGIVPALDDGTPAQPSVPH